MNRVGAQAEQLGVAWTFHEWTTCVLSVSIAPKDIIVWQHNKETVLEQERLIEVIGALTGVAQGVECHPTNQKVAGLIPSQGTCPGHRPGPQQGALERQPHIDVSLPLSPSLSLSLKINK